MSLPTKAEFTPFTCCCYQGRQHAESKWPLSTEPARKFSLGVKNACRVEEQQHLICYSLTFSGGKVISQSFYLPTFLILYSKLTSTPVTDISKSLITNHWMNDHIIIYRISFHKHWWPYWHTWQQHELLKCAEHLEGEQSFFHVWFNFLQQKKNRSLLKPTVDDMTDHSWWQIQIQQLLFCAKDSKHVKCSKK